MGKILVVYTLALILLVLPLFTATGTLAPIPNETVTAYSKTGILTDNKTTDINGNTTLVLTEYINNGGTKTYSSNYTINASKIGWTVGSIFFNLTGNSFIQFLIQDLVPPNLVQIDSPQQIYYYTNQSLSLNYSVQDLGVGISSCWYYILNETGGYEISNTTLPNCQNTTFNVSDGHIFTLYLYANDSNNYINHSSVTFGVSTTKPIVILNSPTSNQWLNHSDNVYFNFTPTQSKGIDTCKLWGNWTGTWHNNYTWVHPTNATMNWTTLNLNDGYYLWNVWCNNTVGITNWALTNQTFGIDTIFPVTTINAITTTEGSQTFYFTYHITELNPQICHYSIFDSLGAIDGLNENVSINCSGTTRTATVSSFATYTLKIYARDLAGNEQNTSLPFTTSPATVVVPGGGESQIFTFIKVLAIIEPVGDNRTYSDLERARIYKYLYDLYKLKKTAFSVALPDTDLSKVREDLKFMNMDLTMAQVEAWVEQFRNLQVEDVSIDRELVDRYSLVSGVVKVSELEFKAIPARIDAFFFVINSDTFKIGTRTNKILKSATIEGESGFSINMTSDTSGVITYQMPIFPPDFYTKVVRAKANYIDEKGNSVFQDVSIRIINVKDLAPFILIGLAIIVLIYYFRKMIKKRLNIPNGKIFK